MFDSGFFFRNDNEILCITDWSQKMVFYSLEGKEVMCYLTEIKIFNSKVKLNYFLK